ncbi:hypothetical protein Tco_0696021 [Tanacetum coccineum]|uniref:Uncharacterized protein n=1 Tax=Tanacetum coccineum TaxID=301880 RepID=A0ABQ5FHA2_9ASTR
MMRVVVVKEREMSPLGGAEVRRGEKRDREDRVEVGGAMRLRSRGCQEEPSDCTVCENKDAGRRESPHELVELSSFRELEGDDEGEWRRETVAGVLDWHLMCSKVEVRRKWGDRVRVWGTREDGRGGCEDQGGDDRPEEPGTDSD